MTQKEIIQRNIGLTFDFVGHLIDNLVEIEKLPDNFVVEFVEKDFSKIEPKTSDISRKSNLPKRYFRVKNSFEII